MNKNIFNIIDYNFLWEKNIVFILINRVMCVLVKWLILRIWIGNKKNLKDVWFVYLVKN